MDTLKGVQEHIETEFGESIISRDDALVVLGTEPGIGPPDLCWLQKTPKYAIGGTNGEPQGYYHWTLGRDVSSSAAVAAYFALLNSNVEPMSFLQGLWHTSEYHIERGFYCCYDPFSRMDVRCELCVPGGVVCGAVDSQGSLHPVTPDLWGHVQVASFLRAQLFTPEMITPAGCVMRYNAVSTPEAETFLLKSVEDLYKTKVQPAALERITTDQGFGCTAEHMDIVLFSVFHHFMNYQRWQQAIQFFQRIQQYHAAAAVYVAAAQRELGHNDAAFDLLAKAVEQDPFSSQLLVAMAFECLYADQVEAAVKLARRAIRIGQSCRPAWIVLSRCYVKQQLFSLALITLNVVPTPPLPREEIDTVHVIPPPKSRALTRPSLMPYDPEAEQALQVAEEDASTDGSRILALLPGAILVNKEPLDEGPFPDVSPDRMTRAVLQAVYCILQELVAFLGWDQFLEARSRVFMMHGELAARGPTSRGGDLGLGGTPLVPLPAGAGGAGGVVSGGGGNAGISPRVEAVREAAAQVAALSIEGGEGSVVNGAGPANHVGKTVQALEERERSQRAESSPGRGVGRSSPSPAPGPAGTAAVVAGDADAAPSDIASNGDASVSSRFEARYGQTGRPVPGQPHPLHVQSKGDAGVADGQDATDAPALDVAVGITLAPRTSRGRLVFVPQTGAVGGESGSGTAASTATAVAAGPVVAAGPAPASAPAPKANPASEAVRAAPLAGLGKRGVASASADADAAGVNDQLWAMVFGTRGPRSQGAAGRASSSAPDSAAAGRPIGRAPTPGGARPSMLAPAPGVPVSESSSKSSLDGSTRGQAGSSAGVAPASSSHSGSGAFAAGGCSPASGVATAGGRNPAAYYAGKAQAVQGRLSGAPLQESAGQAEGGMRPARSPSEQAAFGQLYSLAVHVLSQNKDLPSIYPSPSGGASADGALLGGASARLSDGSVAAWRTQSQEAGLWTPGLGPSGSSGADLGPGPVAEGTEPGQGAGSGIGSMVSGGGGGGGNHSSGGASSGAGSVLPMRTMEADRETAILGHAVDEEEKRLCVRWLDELVIALWHDLQAYMEWKVLDRELEATRGSTQAALALGLGASTSRRSSLGGGSAAGGSSEDGRPLMREIRLPLLTAVDWARRGFLAERLYHQDDAVAAYRAAVHLGLSVSATLALLRIGARDGDGPLVLQSAGALTAWHRSRAASHGSKVEPATPLALAQALASLAWLAGPEAAALQPGAAPEPLNALLQREVAMYTKWQGVKIQ